MLKDFINIKKKLTCKLHDIRIIYFCESTDLRGVLNLNEMY